MITRLELAPFHHSSIIGFQQHNLLIKEEDDILGSLLGVFVANKARKERGL